MCHFDTLLINLTNEESEVNLNRKVRQKDTIIVFKSKSQRSIFSSKGK
jgi:hypothetical protein